MDNSSSLSATMIHNPWRRHLVPTDSHGTMRIGQLLTSINQCLDVTLTLNLSRINFMIGRITRDKIFQKYAMKDSSFWMMALAEIVPHTLEHKANIIVAQISARMMKLWEKMELVESVHCYTEYHKMVKLASRTSVMKDKFWQEKVPVNTLRLIPERAHLATNVFLTNASRMNLFNLMVHARSALVLQRSSKTPCVFLTSVFLIKDCYQMVLVKTVVITKLLQMTRSHASNLNALASKLF